VPFFSRRDDGRRSLVHRSRLLLVLLGVVVAVAAVSITVLTRERSAALGERDAAVEALQRERSQHQEAGRSRESTYLVKRLGRCELALRRDILSTAPAAGEGVPTSLSAGASMTGSSASVDPTIAAAACVSHALARVAVGAPEVLRYFYGAPNPRERFRLSGCMEPPTLRSGQGSKQNKASLLIWRARNNHSRCLWGNMAFGKMVLVLYAALALNVTHLIESGRAGGLALTHYAHFGLRLSSVELYPVPHVREVLHEVLPPSTRLIDGESGTTAVPAEVDRILRASSTYHGACGKSDRDNQTLGGGGAGAPRAPRVGVILDGPKGAVALSLARTLAPCVVFVALDDATVPPHAWPGRMSAHAADPLWRSLFPIERDLELTAQTAEDRRYHVRTDDLSLLLGDRWRP
jgi:hypothetical protein